MISAEYFLEQYLSVFGPKAKPNEPLRIVQQLETFYRLAAMLLKQELPPIEYMTMSFSSSFPVNERNILIPMSGGLGSTACLWWALKQGYTPWVFFADDFTPEANSAERRAVKEIVSSACDQQGLPLCNENSQPRVVILSYPYKATGDVALETALLYFMAQKVARSKGCCRIAWGALGERQAVLKSLTPFFLHFEGDRGTELINSVFPFSTKESIMTALQECQLLSARLVQMNTPTERLAGATLNPHVLRLCHSCYGLQRPCWDLEAAQRCEGCKGCIGWKSIKESKFIWIHDDIKAAEQWNPKLDADPRSATPSWTSNLKRAAKMEEIAAKRLKESILDEEEGMDEPTTMKVNNNKKKSRAKPISKAKRKKPSNSNNKKQKQDDESFDLFADFDSDNENELRDKKAEKKKKSEEEEEEGEDLPLVDEDEEDESEQEESEQKEDPLDLADACIE